MAVVGLSAFAADTLFRSQIGHAYFFDRLVYNALILLAVAACVIRVVRIREERWAWFALTIGVASWSIAELIYDFGYHEEAPFPSVADAFYLAFYPACYVALMLLVRAQLSDFGNKLWFDGAMATLAAAALGAAVVFEAVLHSTNGSIPAIVTNLAYPLGDTLLVAAIVGVFTVTSWRPGRTWALIGLGLAVSAVVDSIYLMQVATDSYREGTILDALWPASLLLLAAAAWQPPHRTGVALEGRPLFATPLVCGLVGLGVLAFDHFHQLNLLALGLAVATIVAVIVRTGLTFRENGRILEAVRHRSVTDSLTGLGNRRRLLQDLEAALGDGARSPSRLLVMFDLDGFKMYNDTFGHPAGDALLARLAGTLGTAVQPAGVPYRLGGDEFCVLGDVPDSERKGFVEDAVAALTAQGKGFLVTSSFGAVAIPSDADTPSEALRLADQRLYVQKREHGRRRAPQEVLLQALYERDPDLRFHVESVADTASAVGVALGVRGQDLEDLRLAAQLHDVGKLAIPDALLGERGPLNVSDWAFLKEHTVIGERILAAAPTWTDVAAIVRSTHERWDGDGYPDGLAGHAIPRSARIVAVCDAYSAMTSTRPYRESVSSELAIEELRRCAGTQFDPEVVEIFCACIEAAPARTRSATAA